MEKKKKRKRTVGVKSVAYVNTRSVTEIRRNFKVASAPS